MTTPKQASSAHTSGGIGKKPSKPPEATTEDQQILRELQTLEASLRRQKYLTYARIYDPLKPTEPGVYEWQRQFHDAGAKHPIRCLIAANQCLTPWTVIETESGVRQIGQMLGETGHYVRSWDGESRCVARASPVFLKGIEPAFHLLLDNGEVFQCSRRHRVLTTSGWLSVGQLILRASGLRCNRADQDYAASYAEDARLRDGQPRRPQDSGRARPPSVDDARKHGLSPFWPVDEAGRRFPHTHAYPEPGPSSIVDDPRQIEALCGQFEDPTFYISALLLSGGCQEFRRFRDVCGQLGSIHAAVRHLSFSGRFSAGWILSLVERGTQKPVASEDRDLAQSSQWSSVPPSYEEFLRGGLGNWIFWPSNHDSLVGGRKIIAVVPLGCQPIMDVSVDRTQNYWAAGVVHHNTGKTRSAAAEVAFHLMGIYPPWWKGRRFNHGVKIFCGSTTNEKSRDIVQSALLGNVGEWGTGWVAADKIIGKPKTRQAGIPDVVDKFYVRHSSGDISVASLKTYEQGRESWQGTSQDLIWFDEEPPQPVFSEGITRTVATNGVVMMTFTPLLGYTEVVFNLTHAKPDSGVYVQHATWEDVPHLTEQKKKELRATYGEHEIEARSKGVVFMAGGLIFPVVDDLLYVDPFEIPSWWPRINGIDFGMDHPTAGAFCALDSEADTFYVYDCYSQSNQTPVYHAKAMKRHGDWIPCSWPRDGLQRDKGSGQAIREVYLEHDLYLLKDNAHYADEKGEHVEPGLMEMLDYMKTGRFKVFRGLGEPFMVEKRNYHRDEKGQIVKLRDDIISATRYAFVMRRFACTKPAMIRSSAPMSPILGRR